VRPDLKIVPLRGNVNTRLAQIEAGVADATLLAAAGLDRLGMGDIGIAVDTAELLPAASQGAVGIDMLSERHDLADMLANINDAATFTEVMAERAFLQAVSGSCHSPLAALAVHSGGMIHLRAEILSKCGSERHAGEARFAEDDTAGPATLATELLGAASPELRALFQQ
jgi:hydroxymethylbilane synthase